MAERSNNPRARRGAESGSDTSSGGAAQTQQNTALGGSSSSGNDLASKVRQQANERLSAQKDHALDGIQGVTRAVRTTTQSLRDQQHDTVARYVEQTADQLDRLTDNLRNKDIAELMSDAQRFARRQPAVFIGSAFAIGLLAARFLKSSSTSDTYRPEWHGRGSTSTMSNRGTT